MTTGHLETFSTTEFKDNADIAVIEATSPAMMLAIILVDVNQ